MESRRRGLGPGGRGGSVFTLSVRPGSSSSIADLTAFYIDSANANEGVIPSLAATGGQGRTHTGSLSGIALTPTAGSPPDYDDTDRISGANLTNVDGQRDFGVQFGGVGSAPGDDFQVVTSTLQGLSLSDPASRQSTAAS